MQYGANQEQFPGVQQDNGRSPITEASGELFAPCSLQNQRQEERTDSAKHGAEFRNCGVELPVPLILAMWHRVALSTATCW